jgi:poly(beta-D-mannuronate) lyase
VPRISPLLAALVIVFPPLPIPDPGPGIGPMLGQLWERALSPIRDLRFPADLIDLNNWYLTLPTGKKGDPDDVYPPALESFVDDWFRLNDARDGITFRANAGGATTKNSKYPRSELREMQGGELASWSNESGTHTMTLRQAVTRLPHTKPHVVTAQIHDEDSDVVMVRLEGTQLKVEYDDGGNEIVIDPNYELGTPYNLRIVATDRKVEVFYNDNQVADLPLSGDGWYFKTGSYVQSNPERGEAPDAVAEVILYSLNVEHSE